MITLQNYFGHKLHTDDHTAAAVVLLDKVNGLIDDAVASGAFVRVIDPDTGSEISGSRGGAGDGGFRLPDAATGRPNSPHKQAKACDAYDPDGDLDDWLTTFETGGGGNSKLQEWGLYREAPESTVHWCHLTTRSPGSGRRTFFP